MPSRNKMKRKEEKKCFNGKCDRAKKERDRA